ncbi:MAG: anti-sigma factor family protein [Omnitrophica WOR_2 bacterium]
MEKSESCHRLLESLSEFIDGTLDESFCTEIEHHLEECENCQVVVDTLRKTIYLYHATSNPPEVPSDVRNRLYRKLNLQDYIQK